MYSSLKWWLRLDSNQRPLPCQGSALPTELRYHFSKWQRLQTKCLNINYNLNFIQKTRKQSLAIMVKNYINAYCPIKQYNFLKFNAIATF